MSDIGPTFVAVISGILGLAIVAVLVSRNAQTPAVLSGAGSALANVIAAATGPVTGNGSGGSFGNQRGVGGPLSALQ
jgi:PRD1 phage membrane DNA delivery